MTLEKYNDGLTEEPREDSLGKKWQGEQKLKYAVNSK